MSDAKRAPEQKKDDDDDHHHHHNNNNNNNIELTSTGDDEIKDNASESVNLETTSDQLDDMI
jgi:hypothetical protein